MRKIALAAIFSVALFLRLWHVGSVPPSLNADEVAIGYNAYSILHTGRDEYNTPFPLTFRSFDDYKMPVYVYLTVPSIAVLGYNDFAIRFPSALFGALTVLFTYFLVRELFLISKNKDPRTKNLPTIAALLLAISPWHLQFSRSAYEANAALFFVVLGVFLLVKSISSRGWYMAFGTLSLGLSVWTYHSSRIFVPLILLGFIVCYWRECRKKKTYLFISLLLMCFMLFPMVRLSLNREGQMRALGISILGDQDLPSRFIGWNQTDQSNNSIPSFVALVIHNRRLSYIPPIIQGYLEHYNPNFFFSEIVMSKYHAPGVGLMYLWELPFFLLGMYYLLKTRNQEPGTRLLFWWFLIAPLAAAPTKQLPHPVRTLLFLPTLQIFTACGVLSVLVFIKELRTRNKELIFGSFLFIILCFILCNVFYYFHQYYVHLPIDYSKDWQYGRKEVVESVKKHKGEYDTVIVSTSLDVPYVFFLYYLRYNPKVYQNEGGTLSGGFAEENNAFDSYRFRRIKPCETQEGKTLYVGMQYELPKDATILDTIRYKDGREAFYLFTIPKDSPYCKKE